MPAHHAANVRACRLRGIGFHGVCRVGRWAFCHSVTRETPPVVRLPPPNQVSAACPVRHSLRFRCRLDGVWQAVPQCSCAALPIEDCSLPALLACFTSCQAIGCKCCLVLWTCLLSAFSKTSKRVFRQTRASEFPVSTEKISADRACVAAGSR